MQKVALAVIIGDGQDVEKWNNLLASVDGVIDKIFVSYNGKEKEFPYPKSSRMEVEFNPWTDDFSEARNASLKMIPKSSYDWLCWLDSDDSLIKPENLQSMLEEESANGTHQIFVPYIYASDEVDGTPRVTQWRERFLSTKVPWRFYYMIHEVAHSQPGTKVSNRDDVFVLHHRDIDPYTHKETRIRNRRILSKAIEKDPDEPRYIYYSANETFAEAFTYWEKKDSACIPYFKEAIDLYKKFGQTNPGSDDAYMANYRIGDSLRMMEQWGKAIDTAMQGIKIRPTWPDCWMLASHAMLGLGEHEASEKFVDCALKVMELPMTNQISEPLTLHYTPYAIRGLARSAQNKFDLAAEDFETALDYWDNPKLREHLEQTIARRDGVLTKGSDKTRERNKGKKPTRSIAFLTRTLPESWNAETLREGSGGAEWCVHEVARRFNADGFRTAIFGTPGDARGVDSEGVEWWDTADYDPNEEFTYVTSVRAPEVFDTPLRARKGKVLWLHDVNMGGKEIALSPWGNRFDKPDHIICLTNWHSKREQRIYGVKPEKITVIGNGINLQDYPQESDWSKVTGRFIYASSPDRGVDTLLQMWPQIKEQISCATLDVYYGWNMLDKIVSLSGGNHPWVQYKEKVVAIYESVKHLDVEWQNRIPRHDLQKAQVACDVWTYPTHFLETYCITSLETAMNGVLPLVNPIGGLSETSYADDRFRVLGPPNHPDYQKQYVKALKNLQKLSEDEKHVLRLRGREFASQFTWDHRFDQWRELLGVTAKRKVTHGTRAKIESNYSR